MVLYGALVLFDTMYIKFDEYRCEIANVERKESIQSLIRQDLEHFVYPIQVNMTNVGNNIEWTSFCKYKKLNETLKCAQSLLESRSFACYANSKKVQSTSSIQTSSDISLKLLDEFNYDELYWSLIVCAGVIFGLSITLFLVNKYASSQKVQEFIRFGKGMKCLGEDTNNIAIISEHKSSEQLVINTEHPSLNILSATFLPEEELFTYEAIRRKSFRYLLVSSIITIVLLIGCIIAGIVMFVYSYASTDDQTIVSWMAPILILPVLFALFHTTRYIQVSEHYFITNKRIYCLRVDHIASNLSYVMRENVSEIFNDADHEGNVYGKIKIFEETISCILFKEVSDPYYYIKLLSEL